ncbi:putative cadmium-transporting ATPase [archaeon BMS3Abin17]|nr:putative cadmium-transporting ATPase [archaeon BMS3Abin17]HDZ61293.1 cadmium-translocating P-type ATPase [Candidatus Pacearchaeota archaeon]
MKEKHSHKNERSCSACRTDIFEEEKPLWKQKGILIILTAGIIFAVGLYLEFFTKQNTIAQILFGAVVIISGFHIIKQGLTSFIKIKFDMSLLITIAAIGAFLIGHGEEGAAVMFLFFIAEFLEGYAAERARKSIASLIQLAPETATIRKNKREIKINVQDIGVGDIIIVKPGDRIPLDGVIVKGASSINQASITGESMPVSKSTGESVFAGTINEEGYLEIKTSRKFNETTISKIVKLVEEAQKKKSKSEIFVDKFARYYTPIVIALSLIVMFVPTFFFGQPFKEWFYRGLVLLVVSCPCAMAISTPVSMVSALSAAARNGVLIKGGNFIEEIRKAKAIVFDKTGTLTEGKPEVTDILSLNKYSEKELLKIAVSLESRSKHPIAETIVNYSQRKGIKPVNISEFKSITGKGLKGRIRNKVFYAGNKSFFANLKIKFNKDMIKNLENKGKTVILIGDSRKIIGIISLSDKIRPASEQTIKDLKEKGIKTIMLTGDNESAAKAIAKRIKIDEYYAELLPEDKVKVIDELLKKHEHVVMVGDGVNDAPALAKAHVGIAMGAMGSDVAIETADVALMQDDLSKISYLIDLSKKTVSVVKQNVTLSILVKGSFAILAFPGIIKLWLAVAVGDMGLSLAVILNALRIGKKQI